MAQHPLSSFLRLPDDDFKRQQTESLGVLTNSPAALQSRELLRAPYGRDQQRREMARNLELERGSQGRMVTGASQADLDYLDEQTAREEADPWAQHYRAVGQAQSEAQQYQLPETTAVRQDQERNALRRLILPRQVEGGNTISASKR